MSRLFNPAELARFIDHTVLNPEATALDIERACDQARAFGFCAVCVHGSRIVQARHLLQDSNVQVTAVVGFPLGAAEADTKRFETEAAVDLGAQEVEVVMNPGRLKDRDHAYVLRELRDIVEAAEERPVKVILEMSRLTPEELQHAVQLVLESGARFVSSSTGFNSPDPSVEDVRLLKQIVGAECGIKAVGNIDNARTALALIEAGANRIGTSAGAAVVQHLARLSSA